MSAAPPTVMHPDDLCVWPDGTYCPASELPDFSHMSDDYVRIPYASPEWVAAAEHNLWSGPGHD